jgi:hypothetical protein
LAPDYADSKLRHPSWGILPANFVFSEASAASKTMEPIPALRACSDGGFWAYFTFRAKFGDIFSGRANAGEWTLLASSMAV